MTCAACRERESTGEGQRRKQEARVKRSGKKNLAAEWMINDHASKSALNFEFVDIIGY